MRILGFMVNPIAGMGGRVGLKGTGSWDIVEKAEALGASPTAAERAAQALARLRGEINLSTCSGDMGESVAVGVTSRIDKQISFLVTRHLCVVTDVLEI